MIVRWVWGLLASAQQSQFGDLWGEAAAGGTRFSLLLSNIPYLKSPPFFLKMLKNCNIGRLGHPLVTNDTPVI